MERIPEIDGLRALAALSVFMFHILSFSAVTRFSRAGWIGVDLFFVISGYLITTILLGMRNDPHYFKNFYMRRTLRIFPPYYLFFLVCLLLALLKTNYRLSGRLWLAFLFYGTSLFCMSSWYPEAIGRLPGPVRAIEVTWSLSIEELFYLIWAPTVRFFSKRNLVVFVCSIIVLTPMVRWYVHLPGERSEYFFFPTRVDTLAFGALLALSRSSGWRLRVRGWWVTMALTASAIVMWLPHANPPTLLPFAVGGYTLVAITMTLTLAFILDNAGSNQAMCRFLRGRLMVRIGTVSYTFYLYHVLMIRIFTDWLPLAPSHWLLSRSLRLVVSLAATTIFSELSWKHVESPILRLKSRFAPKASVKIRSTSSMLPLIPSQRAVGASELPHSTN